MESPEDMLIRKDLVAKCMTRVSGRNRDIVVARFGLNGDGGATLAELGEEFGLSGKRIRDIEQWFLRQAKWLINTDHIREIEKAAERAAAIECQRRYELYNEERAAALKRANEAYQAEMAQRALEDEAREARLIANSIAEIDCIRRGLPPDAWKTWKTRSSVTGY